MSPRSGASLPAAALGAAFLLPLAGCGAPARMAGYTDPDFVGRRFEHPAVVVESSDLRIRRELEAGLVRQLTLLEIPAESVVELVPPTRVMSRPELDALLRTRGVDGVIVIEVLDEGIDQAAVTAGVRADAATYDGEGTTPGPGPVRATARLVDLATGRTAWLAPLRPTVATVAEDGAVVQVLPPPVVRYLVQDGVLVTTVPLGVLEPTGPPTSIGGTARGRKGR
jgi:hypothetical protein